MEQEGQEVEENPVWTQLQSKKRLPKGDVPPENRNSQSGIK